MVRSRLTRRRMHLLIVALLVALVSLTAVTAASATNRSGVANTRGDARISMPKKTIGFLNIVRAAPTAQWIEDEFVKATKLLGWDTKIIDAQGDPAKMAAGMQALVSQKVDAILSLSVQPAVAQAGLKAAKAAGIPVINVGGEVLPSPLIAADYSPNEYEFSSVISAYFFAKLPKNAKIATIELNSLNATRARMDVFNAIKKTRPDVKIVARHDADLANPVQDALLAATNAIKAHPDLTAIYTIADFQYPPVIQAIKNAGKTGKIWATSYYLGGGNEQLVAKNPSAAGVADTADGMTPWIALDQLAALFAKKKPLDPLAAKNIGLPVRLVTKANMIGGNAGPYAVNLAAKFAAKWKAAYQLPAK